MSISETLRNLAAIALAGFFFLSATAAGDAETGTVGGVPKQPLVVQVSLNKPCVFLAARSARLIKKSSRKRVGFQMPRP